MTEGSDFLGGVWARERYDWSEPGVVRLRLREAIDFKPGTEIVYRVTSRPDGGCHVAVDFQRIAASLRGRAVGALVQLAGARQFRKDLGVTLDRLSHMAPGPSSIAELVSRPRWRADCGRSRVTFEQMLDLAEHAFEVAGVAILVIGGLVSLAVYAATCSTDAAGEAYTALRHNMGRTILLGLEVLIVADIILTVAIDQTLENAATLGLIVLVRTFLSFSLDVELDGVVPWHRRATEPPAVP